MKNKKILLILMKTAMTLFATNSFAQINDSSQWIKDRAKFYENMVNQKASGSSQGSSQGSTPTTLPGVNVYFCETSNRLEIVGVPCGTGSSKGTASNPKGLGPLVRNPDGTIGHGSPGAPPSSSSATAAETKPWNPNSYTPPTEPLVQTYCERTNTSWGHGNSSISNCFGELPSGRDGSTFNVPNKKPGFVGSARFRCVAGLKPESAGIFNDGRWILDEGGPEAFRNRPATCQNDNGQNIGR